MSPLELLAALLQLLGLRGSKVQLVSGPWCSLHASVDRAVQGGQPIYYSTISVITHNYTTWGDVIKLTRHV